MHQPLRDKLAAYGVWTYRGAWALEITAALIGLATGLALGYQAFSASETTDSIDFVLASAPFFMVALAELTKIPIATLLFSSSWIWKPLLLIFLSALALITFETVSLGLERAAAQRQLSYNRLAATIAKLEDEQQRLVKENQQLTASDAVASAQSDLDSIQATAQRERDDIRERIADIEGQIAGNRVLSPQALAAQEQVLQLKKERSERVSQHDREMTSAVQQFERQRDSFVERQKIARQNNDLESVRIIEEQLSRHANPRIRLEKKFSDELKRLDEEIVSATQNAKRSAESAGVLTADAKARLQSLRDMLSSKLDTQETSFDRLIKDATDRLALAQKAVSNRSETIATNERRIADIGLKLTDLRAERVERAQLDQVRRLASRVYGATPEKITEEQQNRVALIWFGSLAALAALAGPLTAMVALGLQRIAEVPPTTSGTGKLARLIRRIILHWRWRRVKKVPVNVEIPVEKEVERRVEVPVEKVIQEILYIPILTDDPDAVARALSQEMPSEVAKLVKVSKGRARADQT